MASYFQNFFGRESGGAATTSAEPLADYADFADFATPITSVTSAVGESVTAAAANAASSASSVVAEGGGATALPVVYTKWYRVWERTELSDWYLEMTVVPVLLLALVFHLLGRRRNRSRARGWAQAHLPLLQDQFALVGYDWRPTSQSEAAPAASDETVGRDIGPDILREIGPDEFAMYASGRENVAFTDITVKLMKWHSPFQLLMDAFLGIMWESFDLPSERVEATAYAFDGREKDLVPALGSEREAIERKTKSKSSVYDGFVFGIAHKNLMRKLREDRYDLSLTQAKDTPKLPNYLTVMSESQEITNAMLTPELVKAVETAGDYFEWILATDQPVNKPSTLEEATPKKRVSISLRLPPGTSSNSFEAIQPIFRQFIGLTDYLVQVAHLRPEVHRKVRQTREDDIRRLRRAEEAEKAEERKIAAEKLKKEERDRLLRSMSAEEQRKYLEKEKEKETRRMMKKTTRRG